MREGRYKRGVSIGRHMCGADVGEMEIRGRRGLYHDHDVDNALLVVDWIEIPVACCDGREEGREEV